MLYVIALIKNNAAVKTVATRVFSTEDKAYKDVEIERFKLALKQGVRVENVRLVDGDLAYVDMDYNKLPIILTNKTGREARGSENVFVIAINNNTVMVIRYDGSYEILDMHSIYLVPSEKYIVNYIYLKKNLVDYEFSSELIRLKLERQGCTNVILQNNRVLTAVYVPDNCDLVLPGELNVIESYAITLRNNRINSLTLQKGIENLAIPHLSITSKFKKNIPGELLVINKIIIQDLSYLNSVIDENLETLT